MMTVLNIGDQKPFVTKDGSSIRSILDAANAPVQHQSLAEARLDAGGATQAHYHLLSEEFYFVLGGEGDMSLDGDTRTLKPGDAVLIPPGALHSITAKSPEGLWFLCCCSPPYSNEDTYFA